MRRYIVTYLFILLSAALSGQNLVPNGSFEVNSSCPVNYSEIYKAVPWGSTGSGDLFSTCNISINGIVGVPTNDLGTQNALNGNAYSGIVSLWLQGFGWEFLQVRLNQTLDSGKVYCVSFYVSLSDSSSFAVDSLGAYVSDTTFDVVNSIFNLPLPQAIEVNPIISKDSWTLIEGMFTGNGNEELITIGNFGSMFTPSGLYVGGGCVWDINTNPNCVSSYYYIDSVSVTLCPEPLPPPAPFSIPTLLSNRDLFYIQGLDGHVSLTLYDARGRLVYENGQYINDLSLYPFAEGIYFYRIVLQDGRIERGKVVIASK